MRLASLAICVLVTALAGCATQSGPGADAGGSGTDTGSGPAADAPDDPGQATPDTGSSDTGTGADAGLDGTAAGDTGSAHDAAADRGGSDTGGGLCGAGHRAVVMGHTYAPNHVDPIPNVRVVLVPDGTTFPPAPTTVVCDHCTAAPAGSIASQLSGTDGLFDLSADALDAGGTYTFVMVSGGFRHVVRHVTVPRCGTVMLTAMQTSFAGATAGDDTIPTIAVAGLRGTPTPPRGTNVNDNFAAVLDAMGITGYDLYDPDRMFPAASTASTGPYLHDLLAGTSPTPLRHYQILILPCGSLGGFAVATNVTDPLAANLRAWLQSGGRMYASDLAYSFVSRSFPTGINFAPGPSSHAGADPSDVGTGQGTAAGSLPSPLNATVDDPRLRAWLNAIGATTGSAIPITELRDPWGAMDSLPPAALMLDSHGVQRGTVWVSGDVQWHTAMGTSHHPLTAQVDYPGTDMHYCGRIVFTSYHVKTATMAGMPATTLSPQERVLEYLFFELAACITCTTLDPVCPG